MKPRGSASSAKATTRLRLCDPSEIRASPGLLRAGAVVGRTRGVLPMYDAFCKDIKEHFGARMSDMSDV